MVDLQASNLKLKQRSKNILKKLSSKCGTMTDSDLDALLIECNHSVKLAFLVAETGKSVETCKQDLQSVGGILSKALDVAAPNLQPVSNELVRKFALCIDGGGTKCAAVVSDAAGNTTRGYAGPCNLYDIVTQSGIFHSLIFQTSTDAIANFDGVVSTLIEATKNALEQQIPEKELTASAWKGYLQTVFHSVWIGVAGLDRAGLKDSLVPQLSKAFGLDHTTPAFRLTSDVDLLPATVSAKDNHPPVVVLIAGTGSVAMRYNWDLEQGYVRVARSGGWGHILGDEGGGYSIGHKAIQFTLDVLEERTLGLRSHDLGELEMAVIAKLGCPTEEDGSIDILTEILSTQEGRNIKTRIAGVAEVVLKLAQDNDIAKKIVQLQVSRLIAKTVARLTNSRSNGFSVTEESELVLTGGLMKNHAYQEALRRELKQNGLQFRSIRLVEDVAESVAKSLVLK